MICYKLGAALSWSIQQRKMKILWCPHEEAQAVGRVGRAGTSFLPGQGGQALNDSPESEPWSWLGGACSVDTGSDSHQQECGTSLRTAEGPQDKSRKPRGLRAELREQQDQVTHDLATYSEDTALTAWTQACAWGLACICSSALEREESPELTRQT